MSASTTSTQRSWPAWVGPEKPAHLGPDVTSVGPADVIAAFETGGDQPPSNIAELRAGVRFRSPQWSLTDWLNAETGTPSAEAVLAEAELLRRDGIDVTGGQLGRSQRYGFHYLRWLTPLPKAWLLTGDPAHLRTFEELIDRWCRRRDSLSGEWPGLHVIWYTLGIWCRSTVLLPALAAFGDELSDECWAQVMGTLIGGANWLQAEHDDFRHGNWQLAAGTQLLNLAASFPDLRSAGQWDLLARKRITEHLILDFYPDGGHYERSPGYHQMCLDALQLAATVDRLHGSGELARHPRMVAAHKWLADLTTDAGWVPPFQDTSIVWSGPDILRGAWILGDSELVTAARRWIPPIEWERRTRGLPSDLPTPPGWHTSDEKLPARSQLVLPTSGYSVLRGDQLSLTVNHGPHIEHELESHSHRSVFDFVLERAGTPLLWDAGGPPHYDDPQYQSWYQSARGHNTVIVDDAEPSVDRQVEVEDLIDDDLATVLAGRHHSNGIEQHRSFVLGKETPGYLVLHDRAPAEPDDHRFEFVFQGLRPWKSNATGHSSAGVHVQAFPPPRQVEHSAGRSRLPIAGAPVTDFSDIHTLTLHADHGNLTTVISWNEAPPMCHASGDHIIVETGTFVDRHGLDWMVRTPSAGHRGEGTLQGSLWQGRQLGPPAAPVFESSSDVSATWHSDLCGEGTAQWRLTVTCSGRARIALPGQHTGVTLDGTPLEVRPAGATVVALPYARTWHLTGTGPAWSGAAGSDSAARNRVTGSSVTGSSDD